MTHCTGKRRSCTLRSPSSSIVSRCSSRVGPAYHGIASVRSTTLSPFSAEIGITVASRMSSCAPSSASSAAISSNRSSVEPDEVHLVDARARRAGARAARDVGVTAGLLDHALARVDEDHRDVGGRCARDHVARVLHVPRRVGEMEAAARRDEVAVGDVDRDPLLALGPQAVGEQRQVDVSWPRRREASSMCSSWSTRICFVS